jgi:hypothetical protein
VVPLELEGNDIEYSAADSRNVTFVKAVDDDKTLGGRSIEIP